MRHLVERGYELVERNYRTPYGEIDLIVRKDNTLVFVEVKLRRGTGFGDPLEAVTTRKQTTIRSLAQQYLSEREPTFDAVRFDAVGILVETRKNRLQHVEDAF
ncbi:MAG: YraN family protein [Actinomycetota bacterium]|nr:YraN family protein [Actinomycetota bacterium]